MTIQILFVALLFLMITSIKDIGSNRYHQSLTFANGYVTTTTTTFIGSSSPSSSLGVLSVTTTSVACQKLKQQSKSILVNDADNNQRIIRADRFQKNTVILYGKKWDEIILDDDDDEEDGLTTMANRDKNIPMDMKYNKRNCERSNSNFFKIKDAGGPIHDIYCRRILNATNAFDFDQDIFWFIGKVAHISDVSVLDCIYRQYDLILYHAAYLRPLELYTRLTSDSLQLWYAPGDSEIEVAYNGPNIIFTPVPSLSTLDIETIGTIRRTIKASYVGFQGEVYSSDEEGFRTMRKSDGTPAKPEIQQTQPPPSLLQNDNDDDEYRMPTDEEMERIYKELEGKDINEIYERQEELKKQSKQME